MRALTFPASRVGGAGVGLRWITHSSTFRLFLVTFMAFTASAAIAIGYIYWNTTTLLERQLERTIQAELQGLGDQYRIAGVEGLAGVLARRVREPGNSLYLLSDPERRVIVGNFSEISRSLWEAEGSVEFIYRNDAIDGRKDRQAMGANLRLPGGYRLIVGRDVEDRRLFDEVFRQAFLVTILVMSMLGLSAGWFVSRAHMNRIGSISQASRDIMAGNLASRIPTGAGTDEFDRLAITLNRMLDRIEQLMTGMKEVTDNIAHDLRTPLTRLRQQAERSAGNAACPPAVGEGLGRIMDEADELIATFDNLLRIARLNAKNDGLSKRSVSVAAIVADAVELFEPLAEEKGMTLRARVPTDIVAVVEPNVLGQAIANLIDNAIKYGRPVDPGIAPEIVVIASRDGTHVEIVVVDRGPGIAEKDRERALERFGRLEKSRSERGTGLGLSLVAAAARSLDGRFDLLDARPGLAARLRIPVS